MIKKEKITCIIQARMTSSRLPGKSMKSIIGKPAIQRVTERVKKSKLISDLWLACSDHKEDNVLENFAKTNNINVFRGNMNDVLSRYVSISKMNDSGIIVRITGDCPLIDPDIIDAVIDKFIISDTDYTSNTLTRTYPDGLDVEVFSKNALYEADEKSDNLFMREHVTPYIHGRLKDKFPCGQFKRNQLVHSTDYSNYRWTLDEEEDLHFLNAVYSHLDDFCSWLDVIDFLKKNPKVKELNNNIQFNEGSIIGLNKIDKGLE